MPKVTLGITGLPENLGRDYGIEKPYWGSSNNAFIKRKKIDGMQRSTQRLNKTDWFLCRISNIKEMLWPDDTWCVKRDKTECKAGTT